MSGFFDMHKVRGMLDKATAVNYSEMEAKVRQVTNNDPWGTAATDMMSLARSTYDYHSFVEIMSTISKRLNEPPSSTWRQTYKALQLLEFLILNGSEQVIDDAKRRLYEVKGCQNYKYTDEKMKDQGINIRHRATKIIELLADDDLIRSERKRTEENKAKYQGYSADHVRNGFQSSSNGGFSSSNSNSNGGGFSNGFSNSASSGGGFDSRNGYDSSRRYSDSKPRDTSSESVPTIEPKKEPAKPVADLLGFGDDEFTDFSQPQQANNFAAFSPKSENSNFASFPAAVPAPTINDGGFAPYAMPALQPKTDGFSNSSASPTHSNGFANFSTLQSKPNTTNGVTDFSVPSMKPAVNSNGFANFGVPIVNKSQTSPNSNGFANFGAPAVQTSSTVSNVNGFVGAAPFPALSTAQKPLDDDFGDFVDVTNTKTEDSSIAKLVSLDAFSLSSSGKKPNGPSLNSLM